MHGLPSMKLQLATIVLAGCGLGCDGDRGPPGVSGPSGSPRPQGLVVRIDRLGGATGGDGSFRVGDRVVVEFTVTDGNGQPLSMADLAHGAAMLSGPTFNYQRVLGRSGDVRATATALGAGAFRYRFAAGIPATYLPPLNDSARFTIGELRGQPLLAGTYTVGLVLARDEDDGGQVVRTAINATADLRFGGAAAIEPRDVASAASCRQCHGSLRAHGESHASLTSCLLCHTAGAEDHADPAIAGGTPDVTIDLDVLIHKIHAGRHLPSVAGVGTAADGSRTYGPGRPYRVVGAGGVVHDYSAIGNPVWPAAAAPMPRDVGWASLGAAERAAEDAVRSGPVDCAACHGDPDGAGPAPAPRQAALIYAQPSRMACGSCHDDWAFDAPYTANRQTMPPQTDDATCIQCHKPAGGPLDVADAHRHPLSDPAVVAGVRLELTAARPAGAHNGDASLDLGEGIEIEFHLRDANGRDLDPALLDDMDVVLTGPSHNPNLVLASEIPIAALTSGSAQRIQVPERIALERVGQATATPGETFVTARSPHWHVVGGETRVWATRALGPASALAGPAPVGQNYVDLVAGGGAAFGRDDWVVLDAGTVAAEYRIVQWVDGDRLWFSSPATPQYPAALQVAHAPSAPIAVASVTLLQAGVDYSLDPSRGAITELREFGAGSDVLASYTTDFVMPPAYGPTWHDSPAFGESAGEWSGKPIVAGTYGLALSASRGVTVDVLGEASPYTDAAPAAVVDLPVGGVGPLLPRAVLESVQVCGRCHGEVTGHGGARRGVAGCITCHAAGGAEDLARYVAANAPANQVTVDFRALMHRVHAGAGLQGSPGPVVGAGSAPYPDNFTLRSFAGVVFPWHAGVADCRVCHGDAPAWQVPLGRDHPTAQGTAVGAWRVVCASCHDGRAATGHIAANTAVTTGVETCAQCHGPGRVHAVEAVHRR